MVSSIVNITLYGAQIRGGFVLLTVILSLVKFVIGLRKIGAVVKGRENASSIAGVSRRTSFFFFLRSPGPNAKRAQKVLLRKKTLLLETPAILLVVTSSCSIFPLPSPRNVC